MVPGVDVDPTNAVPRDSDFETEALRCARTAFFTSSSVIRLPWGTPPRGGFGGPQHWARFRFLLHYDVWQRVDDLPVESDEPL